VATPVLGSSRPVGGVQFTSSLMEAVIETYAAYLRKYDEAARPAALAAVRARLEASRRVTDVEGTLVAIQQAAAHPAGPAEPSAAASPPAPAKGKRARAAKTKAKAAPPKAAPSAAAAAPKTAPAEPMSSDDDSDFCLDTHMVTSDEMPTSESESDDNEDEDSISVGADDEDFPVLDLAELSRLPADEADRAFEEWKASRPPPSQKYLKRAMAVAAETDFDPDDPDIAVARCRQALAMARKAIARASAALADAAADLGGVQSPKAGSVTAAVAAAVQRASGLVNCRRDFAELEMAATRSAAAAAALPEITADREAVRGELQRLRDAAAARG